MKQTEFTLQRLKEALNRLKEGKPEHTKAEKYQFLGSMMKPV